MSLRQDIIGLLKEEGYRVNEAIRDALDEFLAVIEDEAESLEEDLVDDEADDDD